MEENTGNKNQSITFTKEFNSSAKGERHESDRLIIPSHEVRDDCSGQENRKSFRASKKSTIIFVPGGSDRVRKINVSNRLIFVAASLVFLIALGVASIITDYGKIKSQIPDLDYLRKENRTQKIHLVALNEKISWINQEMARIREFDRKLRVMTNIENSGEHDQFLGLGGSDNNTLISDYQLEKVHKGLIREMHKSLENLETEVAVTSISQTELSGFLKEQKSILACTPSIRPTDGWLSSGFGYRISPFTDRREFHKGLDIATRIGAPVIAPADGLVASVRRERYLGNSIVINHGYNLTTRYGHLHKFLVKKGQHVKRGQTIGEVGNSGRSTGPHLHYEVLLNAVPVNPVRYILD